jgi:hypothetical protein
MIEPIRIPSFALIHSLCIQYPPCLRPHDPIRHKLMPALKLAYRSLRPGTEIAVGVDTALALHCHDQLTFLTATQRRSSGCTA